VVAVPTAPPETCADLAAEVDEAVCLMTPQPFYAIGSWYEDFTQTTDEEVIDLLQKAEATKPSSSGAASDRGEL
jgi:putative phosphoribosyl transferase